MNKARISLAFLFLAAVAITACGASKPIPSTSTPAAVQTATLAPSAAAIGILAEK